MDIYSTVETYFMVNKHLRKVICNIGDMLKTRKSNYEVRSQCQGKSDNKMVCTTSPSQDESTQQIWDSYLKPKSISNAY